MSQYKTSTNIFLIHRGEAGFDDEVKVWNAFAQELFGSDVDNATGKYHLVSQESV